MALPPRPKQPLLVRRVLAMSTLAACAPPHGVAPQVVRNPDEMRESAPPPQVNCAGHYAGECRGELTVVVRDAAGTPIANASVTLTVHGERTQHATDAQGTVVVGNGPMDGLAPGSITIEIVADGYEPAEQTASIDAGPARVDVVLRRPAP